MSIFATKLANTRGIAFHSVLTFRGAQASSRGQLFWFVCRKIIRLPKLDRPSDSARGSTVGICQRLVLLLIRRKNNPIHHGQAPLERIGRVAEAGGKGVCRIK